MKISNRLNRALSILGRPGIAGIGLLLFAAVVFFSSVGPMRAELAAMQRSVSAQYERAGSQIPRPSRPEPLSDFYEFFPPAETSAGWLATVYAIAAREHLDLPKGEYRLTSSPGNSIATYEAVFALRGNYPQLRAFMAGLLQEVPIAALDDVRLERQRTADSTVDARIRLTFFLRMR